MFVIKCMKCSNKAHHNILFEIEDLVFPIPLPNHMRKGRCVNCEFEILIEGD